MLVSSYICEGQVPSPCLCFRLCTWTSTLVLVCSRTIHNSTAVWSISLMLLELLYNARTAIQTEIPSTRSANSTTAVHCCSHILYNKTQKPHANTTPLVRHSRLPPSFHRVSRTQRWHQTPATDSTNTSALHGAQHDYDTTRQQSTEPISAHLRKVLHVYYFRNTHP